MNTLIDKAAAPVGTISERKDGKYQKQPDGKWLKVRTKSETKTETEKPKEQPTKAKEKREPKQFPDYTGDPEYNQLGSESLSMVNEASLNALSNYANDSYEINSQLRYGEDNNKSEAIALIDKAFEEAPANAEKVNLLYRGAVMDLNLIESLQRNDIIHDKGFVSTTSDLSIADDFLNAAFDSYDPNTEVPVFFTITNWYATNSKLLPIGVTNKTFASQKEFLLNRDAKFRVNSVMKEKDGSYTIRVNLLD